MKRQKGTFTSIIVFSLSRTTPNIRTMFSWSMVCIIPASLRNSAVPFCSRSLLRHLMATCTCNTQEGYCYTPSLYHSPSFTTVVRFEEFFHCKMGIHVFTPRIQHSQKLLKYKRRKTPTFSNCEFNKRHITF